MKTLIIIYKFKDYKKYLLDVEEEFNRFERGFRSRLAQELGIQNAFISKILNSEKVHFSLEQAIKLAGILELDTHEKTYFLWLVEYSRSGTTELKLFFKKLLEEAQATHLNIRNRVGPTASLSDLDQSKFYSYWAYVAVHILTSIPKYTQVENIARFLRLEIHEIKEILFFLVQTGLVLNKGDRFVIGPTQIHLPKESPHIIQHHMNWRLKAIDNSGDPTKIGLHYSTVSSLSEKDFEVLHHELLEVIQNYVGKVRKSPEETACCFNLDFFKLG